MAVKGARGRPARTEAETETMRREISQAAERLFRSEGYAAVSMRRLAAEFGKSPMALYSYYGSKIEILHHLWSRVFDDLFAEVAARLSDELSPRERLALFCEIYVQYWVSHPERYRMVFMLEGVSQTDVGNFMVGEPFASQFQPMREIFAAALGKGAADGQGAEVFDLIICLLHGVAHNHVTMSQYAWTDPARLVRLGIARILGD